MRTLLGVLLLITLQASAHGARFDDVVREAKSLNDLIGKQLNDLDNDGTDTPTVSWSTDSNTDINTDANTDTNTDTNTDSWTTDTYTDTATDPLTVSNPPHFKPTIPMKMKILQALPYMKEAYKDLVQFYWSLHTIRKMVEKHTMMLLGVGQTPKTLPFLLPPSSLIKTAMNQIKHVSECVKNLAEMAKKLGFEPKKKTCEDDGEDVWGFKQSELQFFLQAEMKTAKVFWMTNMLIHFIKQMQKTQHFATTVVQHDHGVGTTDMKKPIITKEDFIKKFAQMLHQAITELPELYKKLEEMNHRIEAKEKETFAKIKAMKKPHDK